MEEPWPDFTVTKLESARRQFETAITLWFNDGDPVSIRTLTAAAHQVCHGIAKKTLGRKSEMFFNEDGMSPETFKKWKNFLLKPENFFKHANDDPDPHTALTFKPMVTDFYLLDGLELYHLISGSFTTLMLVFRLRFQYTVPGLFPDPPEKLINERLYVELGKLPKVAFLNVHLEQFKRLRGE